MLLLHSVNGRQHPLLDAIYSHRLPTTIHVINGLNGLSAKKRTDLKKSIQKQIDSKFPDEKLRSVDNSSEVSQLMHYLSNCKRRHNGFRSHRTQVLAEKLEFSLNTDSDEDIGTLKVWGYVRNRALDVNSLVHIPGFGDFQMSAIEVLFDPNSMAKNNCHKTNDSMKVEDKSQLKFILKTDPTKQQSLDSENITDPMDGEQTWPTEEELNAAKEEQKIVKKVPKGTSEYQSAWIVDNNEEISDDDEEQSDEEEEVHQMEAEEESDEENGEEDEMETMSVTGSVNEANYDQKMDLSEEQTALQKFKDERQYELFPDEVDTPNDQLAKIRFARYRGLKSFRTSSWDPKENLPKDYSRIFQFQNCANQKTSVQ